MNTQGGARLPTYCTSLVSVSSRIVFWADDQTPPFLRPAVYRFEDIDEFLLVFENPVDFIVVAGPEITHHVLVAPEEHHSHGIV